MKKITRITGILALSVFTLFSCAKPGCTDENATNHNSDAVDDDGSCVYRGDITFWCLPIVSDSLRNIEGHGLLKFELEGEILAEIETAVFFSAGGECNSQGVRTIAMEDLPYEYRHYKYRVRGNGDMTLYEGFIRLDANECLQVELN